MARLSAASRKTPFPGQPKPQAPASYPEDVLGSGAGYFGTAPMTPKKMPQPKGHFSKIHAPGRKSGR